MAGKIFNIIITACLLSVLLSTTNGGAVTCLPGLVLMFKNGVATNMCYPHPVCKQVNCLINPCVVKPICKSRPGTKCVPNYCGGCLPVFFKIHPSKDGCSCVKG